ncbi:MAG: hypothetical protein IPN86_17920 [Saprospiraceae bacterium]|nr:hypothetical protein [Saprospiraceae bacterium]
MEFDISNYATLDTSTGGTGTDEATKVWTITNSGNSCSYPLKAATSISLAFKAYNTLL